MKKKALITGITGQDGAYLSELLLEKGYEVHGLHRHGSVDNTIRLKKLDDLRLHMGDLTDFSSIPRSMKNKNRVKKIKGSEKKHLRRPLTEE